MRLASGGALRSLVGATAVVTWGLMASTSPAAGAGLPALPPAPPVLPPGAPGLAAPAQPPPPSIPVFSTEVPAGHGTAVPLRPASDPPRVVDGRIDDWRGRPTGFGGTTIYSHGELVYQDHIFDACGPANGPVAH